MKARIPPIWSGQKFDRWMKEVERWAENNKSTEEDKYVDLLESLKKNDVIKDYVNRTVIEKVGDNRNAKRILEVLEQKYSKTKGEKVLDLMKNISGFKTEVKVEVLMDRFEIW